MWYPTNALWTECIDGIGNKSRTGKTRKKYAFIGVYDIRICNVICHTLTHACTSYTDNMDDDNIFNEIYT